MKLTVNTKKLVKTIRKVNSALDSHPAMPIMSGIKIDADENGLILTGMGGDIAIRASIQKTDKKASLKVSDGGSVVIPAKLFSSVVNKMPKDNVNLSSIKGKSQIKISSGSTTFTLNSLYADNYPHLPHVDQGTQIELQGKTLKGLLHLVAFNASEEQTRPVLDGVELVAKNGKLSAFATDSHRMGMKVIKANAKDNYNLNIPASSIKQLIRLIGDKQNVIMSYTTNQVLFTFPNTEFYSRLIEGTYPDINSVIENQAKPTTVLVMDSKDLLGLTSRSALLANASKNPVVAMSMDPKTSMVTIGANSADVGKTHSSAKAVIKGKALKISFNPQYLMDVLKIVGDRQVAIGFSDPLKPFTLRLMNDKTKSYSELLTPVRTF